MEKSHTTVHLSIAEFSISLFSDSEIELEEGYLPFLLKEKPLNTDITIHCFAGLPNRIPSKSELVFDAENEDQKFYSIYRTNEGLVFLMYNQQTKDEIQQIAVLDETYSHWKVYSEISNNTISPLKYPFGPIMMHYMTLKFDAVMMHASCAFDGKKGRMFSGFSGAGKSTMSKLWADAGNRIINDDRLIIRKIGNEYFVYNTPMYYQDIPKKSPLNSVFLISHSPVNKINRIYGALAISKVIAFSIQNNFEKETIQNRLAFFADLCSKVQVFELGFVPDINVVDFIVANEN